VKIKINYSKRLLTSAVFVVSCLFLIQTNLYAQVVEKDTVAVQDTTVAAEEPTGPAKVKPVKNTFSSVWIIDNQTVMVPVKGTFEMDIMHRFGTVQKGYDDFWGFFAPSNIRLGANYAPINDLYLGFGIAKESMLWDVNAKYAILRQTPGKYPVSVTYYGNMAYDTRKDADKSIFKRTTDRISSFNQLIVARKITEELSLQVAPSISHQNSVNGFYTKNDSTGQTIFKEMKNDHFAIAFSGRYVLTEVTSLMVNYDQPLTKHNVKNPDPNISFGLEFRTSNHAFQLFMGNYSSLSPQRNNLYNTNNAFEVKEADGTKRKGGNFLIGFNITRLWNW
jgi:hypothetical protein